MALQLAESRSETRGAREGGTQGCSALGSSHAFDRSCMFQRPIPRMLAVSVLLACSLPAQNEEVSPSLTITESVLASGNCASILYENPSMANQTIVIDIDNGMRRNTKRAVIEIELDANGVGEAVWRVPSWIGANFNAPGVAEQHRVVL